MKELGIELETLAGEATLAANQKKVVDQERKDFHTVGDKKKFIDKLNATRKQLYGELGKLAHEITGLPANFADQFFLRGVSREDEDDGAATTIEDVEAEIAALEGTLTERKELLEQLKAEPLKAAEDEAKLAEEKATLAALEKAALEAAQKVAAQKAKIALATP
jgi:hypothetical protein